MSDILADKNLLFGVVALQMDFISRDQLIEAVSKWVRNRETPLGKILLEQKAIDSETYNLLEPLVDKFMQPDNDDAAIALAAVGPIASIGEQPAGTDDKDIAATVDFQSGKHIAISSNRDVSSLSSGPTVSRFRILHFYAEGGFGLVSLASDEELHREVAFKELKSQFADDTVIRSRFLLEAEITGRLEHPGIVPVYSLGKYVDGRPFYAMKFIRGDNLKVAIKRLHDENSLYARNRAAWNTEFRRLLSHFVAVCNAIQYAHSRGVLHRDLKPSNIMIGKYGETLVMDWGLAKIVGRPDHPVSGSVDDTTLRPTNDAATGTATIEGSALGTPHYMSPEQAAGQLEELGPATDVYSLGATFYHLLTGQPPFPGNDIDEVLQKVCQGDVLPPRKVKALVPRALQSICLKAMAVRPQDRYGSALAVAEDIECWLADDPVSAHPESLLERAGRWMRHHRTFVRVGTVALLVIASVSIIAAMLINNARREAIRLADNNRKLVEKERIAHQHAIERLKEARDAVDLWLTAASEALKYTPNTQEARQQILQKAVEDYERFVAQNSDDATLELERGRTYIRLGDARKLLDESDAAEDAYIKAEALLSKLQASQPDLVDIPLELANTRTKLGLLMASDERYERAMQYYDQSLSGIRSLIHQYPNDNCLADAFGSVLTNQGLLLLKMERTQDAENSLREAIMTFDVLSRANSKDARYLSCLANARGALGQLLLRIGRIEDASAAYLQAVRNFDALLLVDPANSEYIDARAATRIAQAEALRAMGHNAEELEAYRLAIEEYKSLVDKQPDVPRFRASLAMAKSDNGLLLLTIGHATAAEKEFRSGKAIIETLMASCPGSLSYRQLHAFTCDSLCQALSDLGNYNDALTMIDAAIEGYQRLIRDNPEYSENSEYQELVAISKMHSGQIYAKLNRYEESCKAYQSAIASVEKLMHRFPDNPSYPRDAAFAYQYLGTLQWKNDKSAEANEAFNQARQLWQALTATAEDSESYYHYAWFLVTCPNTEIRDADVALKMAKKACDNNPRNPTYLSALGAAYYRHGEWAVCILSLRQAIELRGEANSYDWFLLSMAQRRNNENEDANNSFKLGVEWMQNNCPDKSDLKQLRAEADKLVNLSDGRSM
jgi:eukaryotic-like serine/threonine-protein kinase